ncbi:hypothetical protein BKK56_11640 [Rodentibacter genomosp. 2]|uniref:hypothetical protein n=1 Tax=Rodentibacter genomosp. 2 TaxID=1908266 RepID=UPI00098432EC|nr:hypothetical protein BKK56_11640 [Rodentibacter genomosp. 2]
MKKLRNKYRENNYLIIVNTYEEVFNEKTEERRSKLISDYKKLYSEHRKCVSNLTENINNTIVSSLHDYQPSDFFNGICVDVNWVMNKLDLPETLDKISERLIYKKVYSNNL